MKMMTETSLLAKFSRLTITFGLAASALALGTGCATPTDASDEDVIVEPVDSARPQGYTVDLNCAPSLPGLPPNPCKPDLRFSQQMVVQVYKPGNPQNIAPGRYIYFSFHNRSDLPTGPFKVRITNQSGAVEQLVSMASLAPGAYASVIEPAPYACGWTRTATLDVEDSVEEYNEHDNEKTYSYLCPRIELPPIGLAPRP